MKVDILIALLLKAQHEHRHLTASEKALATQMIEFSDNEAANALWYAAGASAGLAAANKKLRLRSTSPGPGGVGEPADDHKPELVVRDLDMDLIKTVRDRWQFYRDRRPDAYDELVES